MFLLLLLWFVLCSFLKFFFLTCIERFNLRARILCICHFGGMLILWMLHSSLICLQSKNFLKYQHFNCNAIHFIGLHKRNLQDVLCGAYLRFGLVLSSICRKNVHDAVVAIHSFNSAIFALTPLQHMILSHTLLLYVCKTPPILLVIWSVETCSLYFNSGQTKPKKCTESFRANRSNINFEEFPLHSQSGTKKNRNEEKNNERKEMRIGHTAEEKR